ncbi:MAG: hypothetical protein H6733_08075 [Alphaproteobacteria bacterium]|nr:hypothetical protein [Alphaproteobacteria bacterium]
MWWLMIEDLGCIDCQVDVFIGGDLIASRRSGEVNALIDVSDLLRAGSNTFTVLLRGPAGRGRMAVSVARGRIRHEVVIFEGTPVRYALQPEPSPDPVRIEVTVPP